MVFAKGFALVMMLLPLVGACGHAKEWLVERNKEISHHIDEAAERVDVYVAKRRYVDVPNKSHVTLHNAFSVGEGGERKYAPHLGARLDLPNLQEKLQLRFTTYDEDVADRGINENRYRTVPSERNFGTSLALFEQLGDVRAEFRPRLEYRKEVLTSYLFAFTSKAERGSFAVKPELQLFARSDVGTGQFFAVNFDLAVRPGDLLTLINEEEYTDVANTMSTNHGVRWVHEWDVVRSQENTVLFESTNRKRYHLDQTVVSSSFRHRLWRNVLHYSLTPYATFPKAARFRPTYACDLKVEVIF